jgi:(methylthio)acryloyl-CoA hydratase
MSQPIDQIDNSHTKPLRIGRDAQTNSGRPPSRVLAQNPNSSDRPGLPDSLIARQRGPVALSRLSRTAKRNALDVATIAGIATFFGDPPEGTRAVILHGEGKHFSAGVDLSAFPANRALARVHFSRSWHRAFDRIENGDVPVIAVLQGYRRRPGACRCGPYPGG